MTKKEFTEVLDQGDYSYKEIGNRLIVTDFSGVDLGVTEIPSGIEFENNGYVYLDSLKKLPPDIKFKNSGSVSLFSLESISPGVVFENGRGIFLDHWGIDTRIHWGLGIQGIKRHKILNEMISYGIFDKTR